MKNDAPSHCRTPNNDNNDGDNDDGDNDDDNNNDDDGGGVIDGGQTIQEIMADGENFCNDDGDTVETTPSAKGKKSKAKKSAKRAGEKKLLKKKRLDRFDEK